MERTIYMTILTLRAKQQTALVGFVFHIQNRKQTIMCLYEMMTRSRRLNAQQSIEQLIATNYISETNKKVEVRER